jgi:hypothetical protein
MSLPIEGSLNYLSILILMIIALVVTSAIVIINQKAMHTSNFQFAIIWSELFFLSLMSKLFLCILGLSRITII